MSGSAGTMRAPRSLLALTVLALAAGCVEGEPRFFEDESAQVQQLRVNAYAAQDEPNAKVEVHGLGADGTNHAFAGTIRVTLESQDRSQVPHAYDFVRDWTVEVTADDFSTPTVPFYTLTLKPADLTGPGTYRVWANATIGERNLTGEPALFDWTG